MSSQISLVLSESNAIARNDMMNMLKSCDGNVGILAATANLQECMKSLQTCNPHIFILEVKDLEQGVRETSFLASKYPQATVMATAAEKNPDWILRLIRAGAGEYLTKPIVVAELVDAVNKVARLHVQRIGQDSVKGAVISVFNPSGGMGTTTVAVNLAATLAAGGGSVALVDLNLFSGDIAAFLDLAPRYTLGNVISKIGHIDASFLKSVMVKHSSNVHVLNAPLDLGDADRIQPEQIREVIATLRTIFEYTVVDAGGQLFGSNLTTFNLSDQILFTTVLTLPALKNAKRYLTAMDREGLRPDRVKLVLNRHNPKDYIKISDAEKILNMKAYLAIPNVYAEAITSINKGIPLVTCYPRSPVAKAVEDLARQVTQATIQRSQQA